MSQSLIVTDSLAVKYRPQKIEDLIGNDVTKTILKGMFKNGRLPNTLLLHGGTGMGKCVVGDTLVLTDSGFKKISKLSNKESGFSPYLKSYKVFNHNGEWELPSHAFKQKTSKTYQVTLENGFSIRGTPEHPLLVVTNPTSANLNDLDFDFVHLQNLKSDHYLVGKPFPFLECSSIDTSIGFSDDIFGVDTVNLSDFASILGMLWASNSYNEIKTNSYENFEHALFKVNEVFKKFSKETLSSWEEESRDLLILKLPKAFRKWLKKYDFNKSQVPSLFLTKRADPSEEDLFLEFSKSLFSFLPVFVVIKEGLWAACEFHFPSSELAHQMVWIFSRYGIFPYYHEQDGIPKLGIDLLQMKRFIKLVADVHNFKLQQIFRFFEEQLSYEEESELYRAYAALNRKEVLIVESEIPQERFILYPIRNIKFLEEEVTVYDLSLPETHTFHANGVINHNTTIARMISRYVNCEQGTACGSCASCSYGENHPDVLELNMADTRGIDDIRSLIAKSKLAPRFHKRVFIIDEAHQISHQGKEAFLKPLEEPPKNTIWILCTTNPEKLPKTILGRCQQLQVEAPAIKEMVQFLIKIMKHEGFKVSKSEIPVLRSLAESSMGHCRNALQLLENYLALRAGSEESDIESLLQKVHSYTDSDLDDLSAKLTAAVLKNDAQAVVRLLYQGKDKDAMSFLLRMKFLLEHCLNVWAENVNYQPPVYKNFLKFLGKTPIDPILLIRLLNILVDADYVIRTVPGLDSRSYFASKIYQLLVDHFKNK